MCYITRKEHFNAAHKLFNPNWDKEKNELVYGKCANENWHGHNFELYVTVRGTPDPETGFIIDAKRLGKIIQDHVTEVLDHKNINQDIPYFKDKLTSIENIVVWIYETLRPHLPQGALYKVKLVETENIFVEYMGENNL
ncbi:MAG: 6-carboxytetrahydropterin synthase [Chitinophagales bacterium]|nr:6-carboxytetrahydropterin synthase [Chitinophagales bacterium]